MAPAVFVMISCKRIFLWFLRRSDVRQTVPQRQLTACCLFMSGY